MQRRQSLWRSTTKACRKSFAEMVRASPLSPPMRSSAPVRHSIASAEVFSSASSTPSTIWEKGSSVAALQMVPLSER